jgi:hypothetical protein
MVSNANLHANAEFLEWWRKGLEIDLEEIVFGGWNRLYQDGWPRAWARWMAAGVANDLRKPVVLAGLVREVQRRLRDVIALVDEETDYILRMQTIDGLHSPRYIFQDVTREVAVERYSDGLRKHRQAEAPSLHYPIDC